MSDSVIREITSAIHVRQIQTSLRMAETLTRDLPVLQVRDTMKARSYDATPVFPGPAASTHVGAHQPDGMLWARDLEELDPGTCVGEAVLPLSSDVLINGGATLLELMNRFRRGHTFLLAVGAGGIDGIVTPSDMNKQAGRTHLFMHISALELALAEGLRLHDLTEQQVLKSLSSNRVGLVEGRLARQRSSDQASDVISTLDLQDLLELDLQFNRTGTTAHIENAQIQGLSELRNRVMHAVKDPASDDPERLDRLFDHIDLIERLLETRSSAVKTLGA